MNLRMCMTLTVFCLFLSLNSLSAREISVLFLGNSLTYFYNVPEQVRFMGQNEGIDIQIRHNLLPAYNLNQHLENQMSRKLLEEEDWDYVVLQQQSYISAVHHDQTEEALSQLVPFIKDQNSTPVLYMTWGRLHDTSPFRNYQQMQKQVSLNYINAAQKFRTSLAPVGMIWGEIIKDNPEFSLHGPDGLHANPKGAYTAALTIYSVLTGEKVENIVYRPSGVSESEASFLKASVDEKIEEFAPFLHPDSLDSYRKSHVRQWSAP